ncbi:MAG: shikimate kinase [Actinomycetota bacterium]
MWLIGMMGSGKTTVGRKAAARVGVPFYDTDDMVVEIAHMPISAIWEGVGEEGFRELERRAFDHVPDSGFIAAAGGGAVIDERNRAQMMKDGPVVWLRCTPETLAARVGGDDSRPLLSSRSSPEDLLAGLLEERSALYSDTATDVIDTDDLDVEQVVFAVIDIWER